MLSNAVIIENASLQAKTGDNVPELIKSGYNMVKVWQKTFTRFKSNPTMINRLTDTKNIFAIVYKILSQIYRTESIL